jgi:chorismate-pyruvate lyase
MGIPFIPQLADQPADRSVSYECNADTATSEDAAELGVVPGTPVLERTYRIVSRARPLAMITERLPASLLEEAIASTSR